MTFSVAAAIGTRLSLLLDEDDEELLSEVLEEDDELLLSSSAVPIAMMVKVVLTAPLKSSPTPRA